MILIIIIIITCEEDKLCRMEIIMYKMTNKMMQNQSEGIFKAAPFGIHH